MSALIDLDYIKAFLKEKMKDEIEGRKKERRDMIFEILLLRFNIDLHQVEYVYSKMNQEKSMTVLQWLFSKAVVVESFNAFKAI